MNDPILLRRYVREALALSPKDYKGERRPLSEKRLFAVVDRLARDPLTVDELRAALQWNESRDYVRQAHDDDEDCTVWTLTAAGAEKEGIK